MLELAHYKFHKIIYNIFQTTLKYPASGSKGLLLQKPNLSLPFLGNVNNSCKERKSNTNKINQTEDVK